MRRLMTSLLLMGSAAPVVAQEFDAATAFGAREDVRSVSLSPDGKLLAMVRSATGGRSMIAIVPVAGGAPRPIMTADRGQQLFGCEWTAPTRLACSVFVVSDFGYAKLGFTRAFAVDADGRNSRQLTSPQSSRSLGLMQSGGSIVDLLPDETAGDVLMTRQFVAESTSGTRLASDRSGIGLERVNTIDLTRRVVEQPRNGVVEFITDGHGNVRIIGFQPSKGDYADARVNYCYRPLKGTDCRPLSTVTDRAGFNPYAVDRELNVAYGFDRLDGRQALYKIALDGSLKRDLVLADSRVDVDGLIRIGRQRRVVGASFATERRQTVMFDPALRKLGASLARALPKLPNIAFVDASTDERQLLLVASSDVEPGRYYLYDKSTRELNELISVRPQLEQITLATVKPVTFPASDGTTIPGYLTLPPGSDGRGLPAIVMPHGGPGARDEWGFDWLAQFFANRGYAVLQPNFRGSTGYGDAWFRDNGFQSWRTAIGDVNDAGRWLAAQGIAAPGKLAIVGWSYGGYAALQSAVLDPDLFKAVVAIAPVTDLTALRENARNYANFPAVDAFIGQGRHVREGSPAQNARTIKAPVLMFHGDMDLNVAVGQSRLMESRLRDAGRPVDLVVYKGLDHQLEDSNVRAEMLRRSDAFLRKSLAIGAK